MDYNTNQQWSDFRQTQTAPETSAYDMQTQTMTTPCGMQPRSMSLPACNMPPKTMTTPPCDMRAKAMTPPSCGMQPRTMTPPYNMQPSTMSSPSCSMQPSTMSSPSCGMRSNTMTPPMSMDMDYPIGMPPTTIQPTCGMMPSVTGPANCPGSVTGCLEQQYPTGMCYVPWQQWEQTYNLCQGLDRGTIFPELDLPFMMGRCR